MNPPAPNNRFQGEIRKASISLGTILVAKPNVKPKRKDGYNGRMGWLAKRKLKLHGAKAMPVCTQRCAVALLAVCAGQKCDGGKADHRDHQGGGGGFCDIFQGCLGMDTGRKRVKVERPQQQGCGQFLDRVDKHQQQGRPY